MGTKNKIKKPQSVFFFIFYFMFELSPINTMKIPKTPKSIPNQQNPYQYEHIDIQKITQNHQNFETQSLGK